MVHRLGGIGALSSHNCKLQPLLGCMLVQDLFTTQFVPNRDATPTSWRRVNDSGRHPIPVGAVVVHRQSGDKQGQLRFRHCGSGGHRIRKRTHGARTVRARFRQHPPSGEQEGSWGAVSSGPQHLQFGSEIHGGGVTFFLVFRGICRIPQFIKSLLSIHRWGSQSQSPFTMSKSKMGHPSRLTNAPAKAPAHIVRLMTVVLDRRKLGDLEGGEGGGGVPGQTRNRPPGLWGRRCSP